MSQSTTPFSDGLAACRLVLAARQAGTLPRLRLVSTGPLARSSRGARVRIAVGTAGCGGGAKRILPGVYERGVARELIAQLRIENLARPE